MASTESLSTGDKDAYLQKIGHYCTNHIVDDYSPFIPDSVRILCAAMQMGILDRLSKTSPRRAEIFLAMAQTCQANGILGNAVKYFNQAAAEAPGTALADFALSRTEEIKPYLKSNSEEKGKL